MARRLDEMTDAERRRLAALAVMDLHADEDVRSAPKTAPKAAPASTYLTGGGNTMSPSAAAAQQMPKTQVTKQAKAKPNTKNGGAGSAAGSSRPVGALLPPPSMTLPYAPKSADEQSLVQRSLLWHTAQTKVQKDELHRQNNEIRLRNGWRYDPQQGTTFDVRGRNLTAPVATVHNPAQQARATQAGMMGLSPETFQQRTGALTGAGHYAETHQPRNLRETVFGRTSDEEADWARQTLIGLYSRPYDVWTPGEREDQRKAAELLTKHIKNRKSLGMAVDSFDATLDDMSGRVRQAARSVGNTTLASVPLMVETFQQQAQNVENSRKNPEVVRLEREKALLETKLASMPSVDGYGNIDPAYQEVYNQYRVVEAMLNTLFDNTPVSQDTWASQKMTRAAQQRENALMGLSDAERFVGGTAISMADSASTLPLAAINPALSLTAMGTKAAAQKTHELNLRELPPGEAGLRGIVSGTIEVFTEKLPIENLLHTMKTGGKGFLKNLLRQAGIEGTEEAASDLLNYAADVMASDPEAKLSLKDVVMDFAGGVLSGIGFAGGGTALHYGSTAVADIMPRLTKADGSPRQNVDAARRAGYNQAAEGGVANVQGQVDHGGGRQRIQQANQGRIMAEGAGILRGTEGSRAESGTEGIAPAGRSGQVDASDSEGRRIAPEVRERLNESAGDSFGAAARPAIEPVPGSTMGKNGARALVENAPETGTAAYTAAFHTYYEAGLAAQGLDTVRSVYDGALTDAQKKAAYYAGGKDYLASLESEKHAVPKATVYGTAESGVVENEYAAAVNQTEKAAVDYLARSLGVKVEFVPTVAEGRVNGSIRDGVMQIALDAQDSTPVSVVAMHEITHRMQQLAPAEYRGFRDYAVRQMLAAEFTGETSQTLVEQYVERYGGTLTTEQAFDEIAADYTRELLTSRDAADTLIQADRTLAQKFMDTVKKLIKDLSAFVEGLKGDAKAAFQPELDELQQGYALWRDAFKAADGEVRTRKAIRRRLPPRGKKIPPGRAGRRGTVFAWSTTNRLYGWRTAAYPSNSYVITNQ